MGKVNPIKENRKMVKYLENKADFDKTISEAGDKLVVIDFTATWCPPCRMIAPVFEKMATEYPDAIFVKVDVDDANDVASECGISAMPTFQFFKGGVKVAEFSGASENKLKEFVEKHK